MTTRSALELLRAADVESGEGRTRDGFLSERWGLLPSAPPLTALPRSHGVWDDVARELPDLFRALAVRGAIERMPLLDAAADALPDEFLWRACSLLGMFAHAYVHVRPEAPSALPETLERPWTELCRRLHRRQVALTYDDLIVYNWRLRDRARPELRRLDNLDLLTPTIGNREERVFYLTQVEILALGAPMISAMARAQAAVVDRERDALARELVLLLDTLEQVTRSFLQIDPNPYSETFVDPVVWAKTVAPFAIQIRPDVHAVSGAAAPLFQLLDVFIGRTRYETRVGRESLVLRQAYAPRVLAFVDALGTVSVADFIAGEGSPELRGLWQSLLDAYIGREGFLGVHRKKAFAYLELAFKVGRSVTNSGFSGLLEDQTWELAHDELERTRKERVEGAAIGCPMARLHREGRGALTAAGMAHVVIDVEGSGVRYRPGDRLALVPDSDPERVARTLKALRVEPDARVRLDGAWRSALRSRGEPLRDELPIGELLARGRLRPLARETAKALLHVSRSEVLARIVNARAEDRWELWDLLELVGQRGFDVRTLWRAEPWEPYAICRLVPPQEERLYSIASAMPENAERGAARAELLVSELVYSTEATAVSPKATRRGTASSFVRRLAEGTHDGGPFPVRVVPAPRFRLPDDPRRPLVLFAGGGGISPFLSFIASRAATYAPGPTWLFVSSRSESHVRLYERELEPHIEAGWLRFVPIVTGGPTARGRVAGIREVLAAEGATLLELVQGPTTGGPGASFFACGAAGFAAAAVSALENALAVALAGRANEARDLVRRMIGGGRYQQDVFTSRREDASEDVLHDASTVALHNDDEHGYWMIIRGRVYDVTEFSHRHPGGRAIVLEHAGRDATRSYEIIEHHLDPEIEAMLGMYGIGKVRRLDFGTAWCVTVGKDGLLFVALQDAFRAWVRALYRVVEVENAVRHDFQTVDAATPAADRPDEVTLLEGRLFLETHQRFLTIFMPSLLASLLDELWSLAIGLSAPTEDARRLRRELDAIGAGADARAGEEGIARMRRRLIALADAPADAAQSERVTELALLAELRGPLERSDLAFLAALKRTLAGGVAEFERWERDTPARAGTKLMKALESIVPLVADLHAELASLLSITDARSASGLPDGGAGASVACIKLSSE